MLCEWLRIDGSLKYAFFLVFLRFCYRVSMIRISIIIDWMCFIKEVSVYMMRDQKETLFGGMKSTLLEKLWRE